MKKLVILSMVLVLVLGLAAPALAYTTNTAPASGSAVYNLDVYLVEYAGDDLLGGMISKPAANRGYAKNEIVAAVGALSIPKNESVWADGYTELNVSGTNASLYVTENKINGSAANLLHTFPYDSATSKGLSPARFTWDSANNTIRHAIGDPALSVGDEIAAPSSNATYRLLFFAKVTGDKASLTFELSKDSAFANTAAWAGVATPPFAAVGPISASAGSDYLVLNDKFVVVRQANKNYIVFENAGNFSNTAAPGKALFRIEVGAKNKTERLYMYTNGEGGPLYRILVEPSMRELVFLAVDNVPGKIAGDQIKYGDNGYSALRYFYDDMFEKGLGFSAFNEGNILTDKDFVAIANADDVSDTVGIEPWVPLVVVPDAPVVNPPKTGDTASMLGFVFIGLSAACTVLAVRSRKQEVK